MENNQNNIGCGAIIFIFIIMMIILSQCSGKTESYYYDSNGNGRMDNGEHMYDVESDGTVHYDYDGDGWWDD